MDLRVKNFMASQTELSLDCKPLIGSMGLKSYEEHAMERSHKLQEFVVLLEEEMIKIEAFKRELPLCTQLLTNAMEAVRQELQSQRMKQVCADKANWMASAKLWNDQVEGSEQLGLATSSYNKGEIEEKKSVGGSKEKRKARRCWSPHLHRRFLNALHMLGGSQVATPKQITQLMKVEGLTSDEVKSHLQKYRLHTGIQNPSPRPVFVVGSIWVPPEYAAAAPATAFYGGPSTRGMPHN